MNNAIRYLMEPLLTQFFLIDAICDGFIGEAERLRIFEELARVFRVPLNEETRRYYNTANTDQYKKIKDIAAYERLCRTIEFAQMAGQKLELTTVDRVILAQKREALQSKAELFRQSKNLTMDTVADTLQDTAMNGNVDAMVTLAFMEYHGICISQDREGALKRVSLCAKWNHLLGNLIMLAYDGGNRQACYDTLYTVLRCSNQREVFRYICETDGYTEEPSREPVARVLDQAFGMGTIRRNCYDREFAKVAFSQLISTEDKKKLLLSKKRETMTSLSAIPFDADRSGSFSFDWRKARSTPLARQAELDRIFCGLSPVLHGRGELYQTLLVAGSDGYISQMYMEALKRGFEGSNRVVELDAGLLTGQDFLNGPENFLLRGLSETRSTHTVFLVRSCDEIGERELGELAKLLDYEYRRKFNLMEPTVSLDLSDVLIVLFASENNEKVRRLSDACDVVWTERISQTEKKTVIETMFRQRADAFGCESVTMDESCMTYLAPLKVGHILQLIDGALRRAAYENAETITAQTMRKISDQKNGNGSRREFGYLGGALHA